MIKRIILFCTVVLFSSQAMAADFIIHIPDDKVDWVLSEVYTRFGANADKNGIKDESDSVKMSWCFDKAIEYLSYVPGVPRTSMKEIGATVEIRN